MNHRANGLPAYSSKCFGFFKDWQTYLKKWKIEKRIFNGMLFCKTIALPV